MSSQQKVDAIRREAIEALNSTEDAMKTKTPKERFPDELIKRYSPAVSMSQCPEQYRDEKLEIMQRRLALTAACLEPDCGYVVWNYINHHPEEFGLDRSKMVDALRAALEESSNANSDMPEFSTSTVLT